MNDKPPIGDSIPPLIELQGVGRSFDGGKIEAVREVTMQVRRGDWMVITGPSGSGKSTLLNLMCGLDWPSRGQVLFEGHQPGSAGKWTRIRARDVGFIYQAFNLLPTFKVIENIQIPMFGWVTPAGRRCDRALELLERVGLSHRADHLPGNLSAGERQRVAIARSLANAPRLIIADEPTGNLDSGSSSQVMDLITRIHSEDQTTVVMVTHNPSIVRYGNRRMEMLDGRISEFPFSRSG
jgi:ABC-type lipoprotein export system ATPase subunit